MALLCLSRLCVGGRSMIRVEFLDRRRSCKHNPMIMMNNKFSIENSCCRSVSLLYTINLSVSLSLYYLYLNIYV